MTTRIQSLAHAVLRPIRGSDGAAMEAYELKLAEEFGASVGLGESREELLRSHRHATQGAPTLRLHFRRS